MVGRPAGCDRRGRGEQETDHGRRCDESPNVHEAPLSRGEARRHPGLALAPVRFVTRNGTDRIPIALVKKTLVGVADAPSGLARRFRAPCNPGLHPYERLTAVRELTSKAARIRPRRSVVSTFGPDDPR